MSETHIHIHLSGDAAAPVAVKAKARKVKARKAATPTKPKRKASAYSKKYGKAFKRVASKHKTKAGGWKKGGFKRAQKEAHRLAKK